MCESLGYVLWCVKAVGQTCGASFTSKYMRGKPVKEDLFGVVSRVFQESRTSCQGAEALQVCMHMRSQDSSREYVGMFSYAHNFAHISTQK